MRKTLTILLAVCALAGCETTSQPSPESQPSTASPVTPSETTTAEPTLSPGGFGPVMVGMSKQSAIATGLLEAGPEATPEDACPPPKLVWKAPYDGKLDVQTTPTDDIASIGTLKGSDVETSEGIHLGSTLGEVKQAYPGGELKTSGVGYDQSGYIVEDSGQYLGFLFNATDDSSPVVFIEVTEGEEPSLIRDGC